MLREGSEGQRTVEYWCVRRCAEKLLNRYSGGCRYRRNKTRIERERENKNVFMRFEAQCLMVGIVITVRHRVAPQVWLHKNHRATTCTSVAKV